MIIDLTEVLNYLHDLWDMLGVLLGIGFTLGVPISAICVLVVKVIETIDLKKENK